MSTRVAVVQMCSGQDRAANLASAATLLESAARQGAGLVVLPENFAFLGRSESDRIAVAETPGAGPMQDFLAAQARELGIWIVGGTLPVLEAGESRPRAACLLYDDQGRLAARYDKVHLFDVNVPGGSEGYRESDGIAPCAEAVVTGVPWGRLGLAVCYDVRFPELFRVMSASGMDAVALPAAFTAATGRAHWELLVRARAVDNLACMLAAAQWGEHPGGRRTWGDSMIVNHWGEVLARRREGEGVVVADLDLAAQREAREKFPVLEHRRAQGVLRLRTETDE
jgi:nitrilase